MSKSAKISKEGDSILYHSLSRTLIHSKKQDQEGFT